MLLSKSILPRKLSKAESAQINQFVDAIISNDEAKATPLPLIAIYIGKDLLHKQRSSYLENIINNTRSLKEGFSNIATMFSDSKNN